MLIMLKARWGRCIKVILTACQEVSDLEPNMLVRMLNNNTKLLKVSRNEANREDVSCRILSTVVQTLPSFSKHCSAPSI